MIRRRRPNREIQFSFDSFLDVVANVVGIILRLILVAWAGARMYKGPPAPPPAPLPELEANAPLPDPRDPLVDEVEHLRLLLIQAQAHVLEHLQQGKKARTERENVTGQIKSVAHERQALETALAEQRRKDQEREKLLLSQEQEWAQHQELEGQQLSLSLTEIRSRGVKLIKEIQELKLKPAQKNTLRYKTPVSAPVQIEELQWECQNGRITLLDVGTMLAEIRERMRARADELRTRMEFSDLSAPVGAFRLRYVVERQRSEAETMTGSLDRRGGNYSYGLSGWEAVPVLPERGETLDQAMRPDSEFRRIVDNLEPNETAITIWVYADSFELYRKLRDYLHEKDIVVAGRPLLPGMPIASSRKGTASRAQ